MFSHCDVEFIDDLNCHTRRVYLFNLTELRLILQVWYKLKYKVQNVGDEAKSKCEVGVSNNF